MRNLTAIINHEVNGYTALCPEFDVASQGDTVEAARNNLMEAVELFLMYADSSEVTERLNDEVYVAHIEVTL